jgi:uncharacterized protein YqjF (DUF2071 family)
MSVLEYLSTPARQGATLEQTGHRPWPLPGGSWVMGQTWEDLLFAHWRVDAEAVRRLVPAGLSVDEHDGSAWLGITPFLISGLRLRGTLPVPAVSSFPELNVRTYVTGGEKPGIWFFSLDTSSMLAVEAARRWYRLPYFQARMRLERRGERIEVSSGRRGAGRPFLFEASYSASAGEPVEPRPGSLEHFLTERYCLYARDRGRLYRAEIHHLPWEIREADVRIEQNTMPPDGLELPAEAPLCHLAGRQDVVIWPLTEAGPHRKPASPPASTGLKT